MSAKAELTRLLQALERQGTTILDLVCGGRTPQPWSLYPGESGVFDRMRGSQFYFHAHDDGRAEAGHFHTVRLFADHTVHLVTISMAADGWPQSLFTLNYWAIGDRPAPRSTSSLDPSPPRPSAGRALRRQSSACRTTRWRPSRRMGGTTPDRIRQTTEASKC